MADLLKAVLNKYASLTAANFPSASRPPAFHDLAPQVVSGQVRPPYVTFGLGGGNVDLTFESPMTEMNSLSVAVYYINELDLNTAVDAIRFNGQVLSANAGFDNGTLTTLTEGYLLAMLLTTAPGFFLDSLDRDGKYVYRAEFAYSIEVERN